MARPSSGQREGASPWGRRTENDGATRTSPRTDPRIPRPRGGEVPPRSPFGLPPGCAWWLLPLGLLLVNYLVVSLFFPSAGAPTEIPYTVFREQVAAGNVTVVATRADVVQGEFA